MTLTADGEMKQHHQPIIKMRLTKLKDIVMFDPKFFKLLTIVRVVTIKVFGRNAKRINPCDSPTHCCKGFLL